MVGLPIPAADAVRTFSTEALQRLAPGAIEGYSFVATVPADSVTTFVLPVPSAGE